MQHYVLSDGDSDLEDNGVDTERSMVEDRELVTSMAEPVLKESFALQKQGGGRGKHSQVCGDLPY